MINDKLKKIAFSWHLSISLTIVIIVSILSCFYWFPFPLLFIDGTWLPLILIATVDLIIGPVLTLLLVRSSKSKKELIFDFVFIVSIQLMALSYGINKILDEKPVAIVHLNGVYHIVPDKEINELSLKSNVTSTYFDIPVAMINDSEIGSHYQINDAHILYTPQMYRPLNYKSLKIDSFKYDNLPDKLKKIYKPNLLFVTLVGKKLQGVIIIDDKLNILAIELLT